ncbi:MAG: neutral/alkaline ceramidase [Burkholderiales bacterium]|nr:neutral/alkaline ceramidase [Burkholderiales bacterium]
MKNPNRLSAWATALLAILAVQTPVHAASYNVGVGMSDVTGEAADVGMMGYASLTQKTSGIHQRLRARAFVSEDLATHKSVVIVVTDAALLTQAVHQAVLARLAARYGSLYKEQNVVLTATHTHAGPGGYSHYALYNITVLGFQKATFNAMVEGIVEAIDRAHASKAPGDIQFNQGELTTASRNRSATAFAANPASDRAVFPLGIDPLMTVLTFKQAGKAVGALSLFPTHGTSMTNTNTLISGDNKGYAAYHWEHDHAGVRYLDIKAPFVAAFAQTNPGDMTPNLNLKPGSGPTEDEFENTRIIGERQSDKAESLSKASTAMLSGGVDYRMRFIDMSNIRVAGAYTPDAQVHNTCPAALGASFAAGSTEDGPGPGVANEGVPNPFLNSIGGLVFSISDELRACQGAKQVFVPTGVLKPYPWTPEVLPIQLIRLGQLYLATLPGEPTIMSGYRIRRQLAQTLQTNVKNVLVVGYTNAYTDYITTPEEYSVQDYEGGSTLFGPWTLPAYVQELDKLAHDMATGAPTSNPLRPRDLSCCQMNFQTGVVMDTPSIGRTFGSVLTDAAASYRTGDTVSVRFQSGHPKNNLRRNGTFLEVQKLTPTGWIRVADDGDWSTHYHWDRLFATASSANISWTIAPDTAPGTYRIVHHGDAKSLLGKITPLQGISRSFQVQ